MKKLFCSGGILLGSLLLSVFAMIPINHQGENELTTWMKNINDNTLINNLSIPGTHDSGATHSIFDVAGKCQDISIESQLNIGVRFFDLRLQLVNDEFQIVHSFVKQNLKFKSVMNDLTKFIEKYSSEFIIISIKEEESSVDSTISFEDAIKRDLDLYKDVMSFENKLPSTIKDARGKIHLMSRFNADYGIPAYNGWRDSTSFEMGDVYVQDNYCIDNIDDKKSDILETIEYSKAHDDKLILNFASCYLDNAFPPSYAGTTALSINPWLKKQISNEKDVGIIICDFISDDLTKVIIERNY